MDTLRRFNTHIGKYYFVGEAPCQLLGLTPVYAGKMGKYKFMGHFRNMVTNITHFELVWTCGEARTPCIEFEPKLRECVLTGYTPTHMTLREADSGEQSEMEWGCEAMAAALQEELKGGKSPPVAVTLMDMQASLRNGSPLSPLVTCVVSFSFV